MLNHTATPSHPLICLIDQYLDRPDVAEFVMGVFQAQLPTDGREDPVSWEVAEAMGAIGLELARNGAPMPKVVSDGIFFVNLVADVVFVGGYGSIYAVSQDEDAPSLTVAKAAALIGGYTL